MTTRLYGANGQYFDISVGDRDWLSTIMFGWFPMIGCSGLRKKDDVTMLVRILKNIVTLNNTWTSRIEKIYGQSKLNHHETTYINADLIPFLENAQELLDEAGYYKKFPNAE